MGMTLAPDIGMGLDFGAFHREQRPRLVRAVAASIGDLDRAAEAVDEALARAWVRWDHVSSLDAPGGWVFRVAVNHARSRWRRLGRELLRPVMELSSGSTPGPELPDSLLRDAVLGLPEHQRDVVVVRLILDYDTATAANLLGVPEGTVTSRLSRAIIRLRSKMETQS